MIEFQLKKNWICATSRTQENDNCETQSQDGI